MKRTGAIIGLLAVLVAPGAYAQTPIRLGGSGGTGGVTDTSTAAQDLITPARKVRHNLQLCKVNGITSAANCTQNNLNARPGCSTPSAGQCGKIYATTAVGDGEYFLDRLLGKLCLRTCVSAPVFSPALIFDTMKTELDEIDGADASSAYFDPANSSVAPTALCTATNITNPCTYREAACGALQRERNCKLTP